MRNIKEVLEEMKLAVQNKDILSPDDWLSYANELAIFWQDLKAEMTKYEMIYKSEVSALVEAGEKISGAKLKIEGSSKNYRLYSYLKGRDEIIKEFIKIAKKKATREMDY